MENDYDDEELRDEEIKEFYEEYFQHQEGNEDDRLQD